MGAKATIAFKCSKCGGVLEESPDVLGCPGCGASYETKGGVVRIGGDAPYYGEVPVEVMRTIIQEAREKGWKKALFDRFYRPRNFLYKIAAFETRADWLYMLDLGRDDLVLDIGSGWGTEAVPLARNTGQVVALDDTVERLEFVMVRAGQEGVDNVLGVKGSILDPPLMPGQFDLAVMNGVLEWMGTSDGSSDPESLQRRALENVFKLLKSGGRLYIGIENSQGFKYLLGEPDDHTGVKGISFLPRDEADRLLMDMDGRHYRTYTYAIEGYRALLEGAGFGGIEFYYPIPDYKTFSFIAPLDRTEPYRYYVNTLCPDTEPGALEQNVRNLERVALSAGTLKDYVSSYGIVAEKP